MMINIASSTRRTLLTGFGLAVVAGFAASPVLALATGFSAYKKDSFDAAMKGSKPVLVHVHASWCPVCVKQEKVFNELSGSADFKKFAPFTVDFDMDADFKKAHTISNQSIILIFKGGKEVARSGGVTDKAKIAALLAEAAK